MTHVKYADTFTPLRVTAILGSNVIADEYLPLDGIIRFQAFRDAYGWREASLPGGEGDAVPNLPPKAMPLAKRSVGADWYYACSFAMPQPWWVAEGTDHWNKRFDNDLAWLLDPDQSPQRVIIEKGRYRAYHMPVYYKVARRIEWYCVGDAERLRYLLSVTSAIGKKTSQGWGRVTEWRVEPWPEDWSEWREGRPMRALPERLTAKAHPDARKHDYYGLRPPYYAANNQRKVLLP